MRFRQEAEQAESIVDCDDHCGCAERPASRKLASVVVVGFAVDVASAVNPNDHWLLRAHVAGREDVEIEAVLGGARGAGERAELSHLRAGVGKLRGVQQAVLLGRLWGLPTQIADRRRCVGDAEKLEHAALAQSANWAVLSIGDGPIVVLIVIAPGKCRSACDHRREHGADKKRSPERSWVRSRVGNSFR